MKKGMTLTELLTALAISSVVVVIIMTLMVFFIRTSGRIRKSNILDEEATKLQISLDYIVSRSWTGVSEIDEHAVVFIASVPQYSADEGSTDFATITQIISFDPELQRVLYTFPATPDGTVTSVIAEHVNDISLSADDNTQWLTYDATLSYDGVIRKTNGAVRFF